MPENLHVEILLPAFIAGLLVLATHVPLGIEVLRRGIVFIDLAIAQIAGLGIVIGHTFGMQDHGWQMQAAAITAALTGSLFLRWIEKKNPKQQEAGIGITFIVATCVAMIIMSKDPHGTEHLNELLVGQILWASWTNLLSLAIITIVVITAWFWLKLKTFPLSFYLLFAIIVTTSVQVVGVYLVFASLIVPALAAGKRLWLGYSIGAIGYALGLLASILFDLPSGAAIVIGLTVTAIPAFIFLDKTRYCLHRSKRSKPD